MKKTIFLVRHGESEANVNPEAYNKEESDIHLTRRGEQQAQAAGEAVLEGIKEVNTARGSVPVYVSPIRRAYETYRVMLTVLHGKGFFIDAPTVPALREQAHDQPVSYLEYDWRQFNSDPLYRPKQRIMVGHYPATIEMWIPTESFAEVYLRTQALATRVLRRRQQAYVVVAHKHSLRALSANLKGLPMERSLEGYEMENGEVLRLDFEGDRFIAETSIHKFEG